MRSGVTGQLLIGASRCSEEREVVGQYLKKQDGRDNLMPAIPCFLCGKQLRRRIDKNRKPYFICDPCGTQIFIRRKQGIDNLVELIATLEGRDLPFREHARVLYKIQAVLAEIRGIKKEIKAARRGTRSVFAR